MFTLAHLSDPHLPLPRPPAALLFSKRALGYLSWLRRRKAIHRAEVLARLVADVQASAPDHIAVTGDLCNISLPEEYRQAARWLKALGAPDRVSLVPGNHDAYVAGAVGMEQWSAFMAGDDAKPGFPWLRVRDAVALVGVSTAAPMSWISAGGLVGPDQTRATEALLRRLGAERLFRVLLIHHPPIDRGARRKRLIDIQPFAAAVSRAGVELVLHGHTHVAGLDRLPTAAGEAPVIGVPSASARAVHHARPAGWNLYRIERDGSGFALRVAMRGLVDGAFSTLADYRLRPVGPSQSWPAGAGPTIVAATSGKPRA
jgi:3',5'-cyclic AMP phosphodiesterase CpdA